MHRVKEESMLAFRRGEILRGANRSRLPSAPARLQFKRLSFGLLGIGVVLGSLHFCTSIVRAADDTELAGQPTWSAPSPAAVRADVFHWLAERKIDQAKQDEIARTIWPIEAAAVKPAESKAAGLKAPTTEPADHKTLATKSTDAKPADTKFADAKTSATKPAENKTPVASEADAKPIDASAAGPKLAELKPPELLDRVVRTIAAVDPPARQLVELCSKPRAPGPVAPVPWLADQKLPMLVRANLRLWYGQWLVHQQLYDESLDQLSGLEPADVVDPAALLFYQGVDYHWLLKKQPGLKTLARLLERRDHLPRRYAQMADLMQTDLAALKDDSLDHIDRRMRDTERRLDLGGAGKKTRGVEDGIIASLDKMIDQMEKQQSAASSAAGGQLGPGGKQSSSPAPDSAPLQGKGPGEITAKNIGHQSGWGDLPPKQREEALQAIGKEFPSHFRDAIEAYFKRLATDE
jgi:hypothetical protein